jgi:hypothetical protein
MLLNRTGGVVCAWNRPWALVHKTTYNFYGPVRNAFEGGIHYIGKWEGVRPWKSQLYWAPNGTRLSARCHFTGPKKVLRRTQPPPTCPLNRCCPHQNHYVRGHIHVNHRCIYSYYIRCWFLNCAVQRAVFYRDHPSHPLFCYSCVVCRSRFPPLHASECDEIKNNVKIQQIG